MRERAATARVEAGTRRLDRLGAEAAPREAAERACRLVAKEPGAAGILAGHCRRRARIVDRLDRFHPVDRLAQRHELRNREVLFRDLGDVGDQRARGELALAAALGVA